MSWEQPDGVRRELLVAACHPWTRGVHVGTDGTRLAHAQLPRLIT